MKKEESVFVVARDDERGSAFCIDPCRPGDGEKKEDCKSNRWGPK